MTQEELNTTLDQLISLGANREELELWRELYPTLPEDKKLELEKNLTAELEQLKKTV